MKPDLQVFENLLSEIVSSFQEKILAREILLKDQVMEVSFRFSSMGTLLDHRILLRKASKKKSEVGKLSKEDWRSIFALGWSAKKLRFLRKIRRNRNRPVQIDTEELRRSGEWLNEDIFNLVFRNSNSPFRLVRIGHVREHKFFLRRKGERTPKDF